MSNKTKFISYFYEFIVLFASIYIAFELEEWDENQDFTNREEEYLVSLHQDLSKDLNQLNRRIVEYDEKIQGARKVLQLLEGPYQENREAILGEFQSHLLYHFNYNPINNTLETLKTSGDLKLIKNLGFKILLSELDKSYSSTLNQGITFNNYIEGNEWAGFFINNFDIDNLKIFSDQPNLPFLFKNKVRHYITLIESYYYLMQGTLNKIEEVKSELEREMSSRKLLFDEGGDNSEETLRENELTEDSLSHEIDNLLKEIEPEGDNDAASSEKMEEMDDDMEKLLDELESDSALNDF